MTATRAVVLVALLVVGGVAVAAPAAGAALAGMVGTDAAETSDGGMGSNVSSFMQASAADANASVDTGMFVAAYENDDNETRQKTVVLERTEQLERRVARLEAQHDRLTERKGEMNDVAYEARMARLTARLNALYEAIDETAPRADEAGVGTDRLNEIRQNASNMTGQEVAAIASGMAGIDPPRGPPDDVPGNGPSDPGPGENGPPGDAGNDSAADDNGAANGGSDGESSTEERADATPGASGEGDGTETEEDDRSEDGTGNPSDGTDSPATPDR